MKSFNTILVLLYCLFNSNAQVVSGWNFELWDPGCPVNTAPIGWTNFSTSLGSDQSGVCAGTVISYQGDSHMNLVWWTGSGLFEGAEQTITGFTPGQAYKFSFYAINNGNLYSAGAPAILDAYLDSVIIFSTPELSFGGTWTNYGVVFNATSTSHTIGFRVAAGSTGSSGSMGVDAVQMTLVTDVSEQLPELSITVSPNPGDGYFTFRSENNIYSLEIWNVFGEKILSQQVNADQTVIDLVDQPSGVYLYIIQGENNLSKTGRLIINSNG